MKHALQSTRETAAALGMSASTVMRLYTAGVIDAEINEGRVIRFDAEKCRRVLAERAKAKRGAVEVPAGMVPTC